MMYFTLAQLDAFITEELVATNDTCTIKVRYLDTGCNYRMMYDSNELLALYLYHQLKTVNGKLSTWYDHINNNVFIDKIEDVDGDIIITLETADETSQQFTGRIADFKKIVSQSVRDNWHIIYSSDSYGYNSTIGTIFIDRRDKCILIY